MAPVPDAVVVSLLHGKITSINVNDCDNLTDKSIKAIAEGSELKELRAESCLQLNDESINVIAEGSPKLKKLNVSRIKHYLGRVDHDDRLRLL